MFSRTFYSLTISTLPFVKYILEILPDVKFPNIVNCNFEVSLLLVPAYTLTSVPLAFDNVIFMLVNVIAC